MDTLTSRTQLHDAVRAAVDAKRQEILDERAERDARRRKASNQIPMLMTIVISWGVLAWLWIARPAAVFDPRTPAPAVSGVEAEARARYALFLQRSRIDAYRQAHGRLPATLEDAGAVEEGVIYVRAGSSYVLTREANGAILRLTATTPAETFLGNSLEVLRAAR